MSTPARAPGDAKRSRTATWPYTIKGRMCLLKEDKDGEIVAGAHHN